MILVIDNFDSFVNNLVRYVREAGASAQVIRNDSLNVAAILAMRPAGIIISPGPKTPREAGVCLDLVRRAPVGLPILGVCLGHQCLVEALGGETLHAEEPLHGEASLIHHTGEGVFAGIASPTPAARYHSLIAKPAEDALLIETAWTENGGLMGVSHRANPWHGLQFHPESLLTPHGRKMIENFLALCAEGR